ncbi:hypothetical protein NP233_g4384 [Leucocoprinus birnbaumii]|uniref:Cytochrome P450 n=1 Tax=Leucocoprinus birnbaumii TaxID=56174 RepID=A0AAD5YSW0_9AGAR|nr:hypothetical protein NP233_g4384 [Leucocoprinus birnbaumii]
MDFTDLLPNATLSTSALALAVAFYVMVLLRERKSPLSKIPTVGASGIITSRFSAMKAFHQGHAMIQEGYEKYTIFKIPRFFSWMVVITGREQLEDIRKASDDFLSFSAVIEHAAQLDYTISPKLRADYFHINVVRGPMTRNIGARFPELLDEIDKALGDVMGSTNKDWVSITCYSSVAHIVSRLSARFFVGSELSSNARYTKIMQDYVEHVMKNGVLLRLMPNWLKPYITSGVFRSHARLHEVEDFLRPILSKRLEHLDNNSSDIVDGPNDMLTWLWNSAPEAHRTLHDVAIRMIFLNIAAIHTTASLLTHVLFNLATYTSYVKPLREEISDIINKEGWTKISMEKLKKLDSFVKESQRLHGSEAATVARIVHRDYTFSDGTLIPKGTHIVASGRAINHDERYYPNPQDFQGFRFLDKDPLKWQMTAINPEDLAFGFGRHACPGRFFAIAEVKAIVARLLLEYDIRLTEEGAGRPRNDWFTGIFVSPNRKASISLRKREGREVTQLSF